jgi:hypothetical protein
MAKVERGGREREGEKDKRERRGKGVEEKRVV